MEKEICRRHMSREGTGCVWVFMSMFDFRNGGSNHKLLMDKKRGSKRIIGISGMFETKVEKKLTCDCEESEGGMQSVKKLIEDECDFECRGGGTKERNRKRRSKTFSSKTSEDINVLIAGDDDHECHEEGLVNYDSEEKFSELIKRLIAHQKDSEVESCKNLEDAFQVLDNDTKTSQCTQAIVILKSEPSSLDVGTHATRNKTKYGRFGSRFILSRIRRRLKSAVGKNPCNAQHDSDPDQNSCLGEEIEISSGRRISSGGDILPDIASQVDNIHGGEDWKTSTCGIYIAAKKHLSEMLAEGDIDVDSPDKEEPRILGKILALPEFSTPESSPRMTEKPNFQQCGSEDYAEPLGLDLDKHEETEFTSNMPVLEDTGMEEEDSLPEAISSSIIEQDAYVDEDHEQKQLLEKQVFDEEQSPCSPPNSSVRMSECQENTADVLGKSSPVSVLEPLFTDDDTSPNSSRFSPVEMRMQPLCIRFDEPDSPRPEKNNDVKTIMDDKEQTLAYIQAVVESSELNWEELLARSVYSEQLLEQALLDDIDFCSTNLCSDKKLLFDCINEVLMDFCGNGPWISFIKPGVRFFPDMENVTEVVQEEVYWHLLPLPSPHTLDQIVWKDLARSGIWMDLRFDIGCIGSEIGERILDELLEEIISNFTDLVQAEIINTT